MIGLWCAIAAAAPLGTDPTALLQGAVSPTSPEEGVSTAVRLLVFLTGLSFIPAMLVVMTPFVRFVVVFSLLRQALGLNQSPPNQVVVGISLFLTLVVMQPIFETSWQDGVAPFLDGQMQTGEALDAGLAPFRSFMLDNVRRADMATVLEVAQMEQPNSLGQIPTAAIASAYTLSELQTAFVIAVYVYVPFLVVDFVVSSVLLGLGMTEGGERRTGRARARGRPRRPRDPRPRRPGGHPRDRESPPGPRPLRARQGGSRDPRRSLRPGRPGAGGRLQEPSSP